MAKLKQQLGEALAESTTSPPAPGGSPSSVNTPIGRSLLGANPGTAPPPGFDPASLFAVPGSENTWLQNDLPRSLAKTIVEKWLKNLDISSAQRSTLNTYLEKATNWWSQQNDNAVGQIHKVAVMTGIPASMITSNVNIDYLLNAKVLTVAITMTC